MECPGADGLFSQKPLQKLAVLQRCMQEISRMAAKLRPVGRQTTPPNRAGELPAYNAVKQHNFFTGFGGNSPSAPGHSICGRCQSLGAHVLA